MNSIFLDQFHSADEYLSKLINHIVQRFMFGLYSICILWNPLWDYEFAPSLNEGQDTPQIVSLKVNHLTEFEVNLQSGMELNYCQGFIVFEEDIETFLEIYERLSAEIQRRFPRYHFVFVVEKDRMKFENGFQNPLFIDSPDVLFIERVSKTMFNLWTTKFNGQANHQDLILLDKYDAEKMTFSNYSDMFPDKLSDLKGRRLKEINEKGNVHIADGSTTNGTFFDGTEGRLLLFFCEIYNCTLELLVTCLDDDAEWGEVNENYTGTGLLGSLATRKVEVIISALYLWYPEHLYFHYSAILTRTGVTCVIPVPRRLVSWFLPFQPFSLGLWLAIITSLLTIAFALGMSNTTSPKGTYSILQGISIAYRISVSQSVGMFPKTISGKLFILVCLLIGFIITNIYGSGLSSFLTLPSYEEAIDTKEQLAARQQAWGATSIAWVLIIQNSEEDIIKTLVKNFEILSESELFERGKSGNFAFSIERLPYGHYAAGDYITPETMEFLQPMLYDIYFQYCVLMSFKTWPLMEHFNYFVLRVQQSGIQSVLEQDVVTKYSNLQVQLQLAIKRQNAKTHEPRTLELEDVMGILVIWLFGVVMSLLAFLYEIISHRFKRIYTLIS